MEHNALIGLVCFLGMLGLIALGVPIFIAMLVSSFIGSMLVAGPVFTFQQFAVAPYNVTSSYAFAVVPLFILMSSLASNSGIAQDAYDFARKWLGNLRGGLLMVTIGSSALFGAACGSSLASAAVFSKMAYPELEKQNYDRYLSMGCIAASGSLASLIPPSVGVVIICILVEQSIGKALVGGIIPGLILTLFYALTVQIAGIFKPKALPKVRLEFEWKEKLLSLFQILPIFLTIILIIGGMYFGIFPPTVGGAIGSTTILVISLLKGVPLKNILNAFKETVMLNAQIFPLIISGFLFSRFLAISGLPRILLETIREANLSPYTLMFIVIAFYLFIGCVLEFMSMAVVTAPVIYPMLVKAGFDPIATVIILVFLSEIALLTPPIGMTCFTVSSILGIKLEESFKSIIPFYIPCMGLLLLLVFFPQIASFLPNFFYK